jgi:hypothetical protein
MAGNRRIKMQKTLTVGGKKYTGKQIAAMFSDDRVTNGGDFMVVLGGNLFFANYRHMEDSFFAPVCDKASADAISLMPNDGSFSWSVWLTL